MAFPRSYQYSHPFVQQFWLHSLKGFATDYPHTKCLVNYSFCRVDLVWQTLPSEVTDCSITTTF